MGEGSLVRAEKAQGEVSAEANGGEDEIGWRGVASQTPIAYATLNQGVDQGLCSRSKVGAGAVEERVEQVDEPDPVIDGRVHVPANRLEAVGLFGERRLAGGDAPLQRVTNDPLQQRLLVGKVSIQRANAHTCTRREGVPCWFAADLEGSTQSQRRGVAPDCALHPLSVRWLRADLLLSMVSLSRISLPCATSSLSRNASGG